MLQRIARIVTALVGALLAGPFAFQWLLAPAATGAPLGISLDGAAALSHMRGDTGGAFLAVGALALLGLYRREPGYLEAVALVMVCIVAGRLLGVALDGFAPQVGVAIAVELVIALVAFTTARDFRARPAAA